MRIKLPILLIIVYCVCGASLCYSQWQYTGFTVPNSRHGNLNTGWTQDSQHGSMCFKKGVLWLGYQGQVFKSLDTGKTWQSVPKPFDLNPFTEVHDISFYNDSIGVVSMYRDTSYITFDQGNSWYPITDTLLFHSNDAIVIDEHGTVFATGDIGIFVSTDSGKTSTKSYFRQGGSWYQNYWHIVLSANRIIFALKRGIDTLGFIVHSSDTGRTWKKSSPFLWDPHSVMPDFCNDSFVYVAIPNSIFPGQFDFSQILQSSNRGDNWDTVYSRQGKSVSGTLAATPKAVYAGTITDGLLRSTDKGRSWKSIGGPQLWLFTRLLCAVNDNIVFVVDTNGAVWVTYNSGGDPIQQGETPTLTAPQFPKVSSCSTYSAQIAIGATGCGVMTIDSISIIGQAAKHFLISTPTFPSFLTEGTSNSWDVQFSPLDQVGVFTTTLHIKGHYKLYSDSLGIDTIITISAESLAEPPRLTTLATSYNLGTASTCNQVRDTVITFRNTGCDTLCITQGPGALPPEFVINALTNPYCLPPDSSVTINVRFTPSATGTFRAYPKYRAQQQGLTQDVELFLEATGIEGDGTFAYEPKSFDFNSLSICSRDSGSGYITNTGCDTLSLTDAKLLADADYTMSSLPPLNLIPNDTIRYTVYLNPQMKGVRRGYIVLSSTNRSGLRRDSIPITVNVIDGTRILASSRNTLNFGTTTLCEERDSLVTLRNTGCDTLRVSGVGVQGIGFSSNVTTPIVILPGESIDIPVNTIADTSQGNISTGVITFTSDADNQIAPITLSRGYTYPKSYSFHIAMLDATATSGEIVRLAIVGEQGLGNAGSDVKQLDFDLTLNEDLLEYIRPEGGNTVSKNGSHITISNPNELVSTDDTLAILVYHVFLTKDSATDITVSNISINNGDTSACAPKIAAATLAGFTYRYECGDKHIQSFLRTGHASLEITSIHPNPAKGELTVEFVQNERSPVSFEVYDMLGTLILKKEELYDQRRTKKTIGLRDLPSGSYVISLRSAGGVTSKRFTKEK